MKALLDRAVAYVKDLYAANPVRVTALVVAVLTAVGLPLTVGGIDASQVVGAVLLILLGGETARQTAYSPKTVESLVRKAKKS